MYVILILFTLLGFNFGAWTLIGLIRLITEITSNTIKKVRAETHSSFKWVLVFISLTGLDIIIKHISRLSKKFINYLRTRNLLPYSPDFSADGQLFQFQTPDNINPEDISIEFTVNSHNVEPHEVAAIIPAYNEEMTIAKTIESVKRVMPAHHIFVGSDASTDRTEEIVKGLGANVIHIYPNKGKARTLMFLLSHYKIYDRFKAVIIIDADSEINADYLKNALPLFDNPKNVAVAVHAKSKWYKHFWPKRTMLYAAYRVRLYRSLQAILRYGQTWKYTNFSFIVPGFASMYRTSVIKKIKIDAPGLVIEDFNMTFELQHQKLGKIAYSPNVYAHSQDPISLRDYFNQIKRWNLGFWQTVRRHGFWPSIFMFSTSLYIAELLFFGAFFLLLPLLIAYFAATSFAPVALPFTMPILEISQLRFVDLMIGIFLFDYIITVIVAIYERKPVLLIYGLVFIVLRYIDAITLFYSLFQAFSTKSDGSWKPPERQVIPG